ncbi:MAG: histidine kinase [Phycisphaeraceae bacterium]|nr:MAG: histidine kinase [Phycisphaeraceae bacterium]
MVSAGLLGAGLVAAIVLMALGPGSWYGPVFVMGIAALLVWWFSSASDRGRERELRELGEQIDRIAPDEGAPARDASPTLTSVLRRLGDLERRTTAGLGSRDAALRDLRGLIDAVDVPVIGADAGGVVESVNRAGAEMLGRERGDIVGRLLEDLLVQPELAALVARARGGARARGRVRSVTDEGVRYYDVTVEPVARAGEGGAMAPAGVVLTLLDVTQLAAAVQLKTDFAANASHELRTPIAAIKGAADTMQAAQDDPVMTARLRTMIVQHVGRLEELVDDLLDLSRLEAAEGRPEAEPVAMSELAGRLDGLFTGACAERRVRLTYDLDPALERMVIDATLLELILRNLVDNALKFAREGTEVRLIGRASDVERAHDAADAGAPAEDAPELGARFRVVDEGQGIPLADQQRIFERFYQVDTSRDGGARRRGTGLGLAIVKHALRRLGGRISVESVWQQGTTMTFEIPRCVRMGDPESGG